ncbi:MAG: glycosyltransferase family 39 protein, partial [Candidatus Kapaibacterium sp.]
VGEINISEMIGSYDQLIANDSLPRFPFITKPPGHFLTYIATERLGRLMLGTPTAASDRLQQLANFASFLWPLFTFLALFPLYFLGRRFLSEEESRIMLLLYTLTPNIVLMTMHLDQCLLPLLFLSVILLFLKSVEEKNSILALLSGLLLGISSFFSFSMVTLFPLLVLWHAGAELLRAKRESNSWKTTLVASLKPTLTPLTLTLIGFALFHLILLLGFDYNWIREYQIAQEAHGVWKIQEWDLIRTIWVGFLDLFEYAVWIGFPIALFALLRSGVTIKRLRNYSFRSGDAMILSLLFLMFLLSFFGKTVAETGRLWIFLLPLVLIVAVMGLRLFPKRSRSTLLILLILLQFLHTFFMRWLQDFA